MKTEVFLDAAYAIALSVPKDSYHERAVLLADELEASKTRLVTTRAVMLEIGNALSKQRYRHAAVELLQSLQGRKITEALTTNEHFQQAGFRALLLEDSP